MRNIKFRGKSVRDINDAVKLHAELFEEYNR